MNAEFQNLLQKYNYPMPEKLIAQQPASPRDSAKLLVYQKSTNNICFDTFSNLGRYLPKGSILVFNETRVIPARLTVTKPTGGKVDLLYIDHNRGIIKALANKPLPLGSVVSHLHGRADVIQLRVIKKSEQFYFLKPNLPFSAWLTILQKYGLTPLPPYIKHSLLTEKQKREKYQAVFAKTGESVAAPTASLHFTNRLINNIKKQGIDTAFVRLDVNLGTFAPLREDQVKTGHLHQEFYNINKATAQFLNRAKNQGRQIIAVGTTVTRTLESAAMIRLDNSPIPESRVHPSDIRDPGHRYYIKKLSGQTDLFISEDYRFKFIDGLITNFHVPKSSLLMLVSALTGREKLFELYREAIKNDFRFFSFGDGMLIIP